MLNVARAVLIALVTVGLTLTPLSHAQASTSMTAAELLATLTVATPQPSGYDRTLFTHWVDADSDGCDTRAEVLKAQDRNGTPVTFSAGCSVATGEWFSWYDGTIWTNASDVDIDHLVPLGEAWASGAAGWTPALRQQYANDLDVPYALQAVTDNVNQSKGDRDPALWMPPSADAACQYVTDWILVKYRWSLTIDSSEQSALANALSGACGSAAVQVPTQMIPAAQVDPPTTVPDPAATPQPVFRFWSPIYHSHFYTIDPVERDHVMATWPTIWNYEGQRYEAFTTKVAGTVPLYRFWSARFGGHFYTADPSEKAHVSETYDSATWSYEHVAYYVFPADSTAPDTVAVSRFWSPVLGHHFYTADQSEQRNVTAWYPTVWGYEGPRFRVPGVGIPLSASVKIECTAGTPRILVTSSNPNASAVDVGVGIDGNGDGIADSAAGFTLSGSTFDYEYRGVTVAAGSSGAVIVSANGGEIMRQAYHSACPPPPVVIPPSTPNNPGDSVNCTDFPDWATAQAWFDRYYRYFGDVARLDQDNDLIACESNRGHP